jgi:hypothetical protein
MLSLVAGLSFLLLGIIPYGYISIYLLKDEKRLEDMKN